MNKKLLVSLPLTIMLFQGASTVTAQDECEPMVIPPVCQDARQITVNINRKMISPPNICVEAGEDIPVKVKPRGARITIKGKTGGWPSAAGQSFVLTAPAAGEYDYNVYFGDGSCVDPRVTVK